MAIKSEIKKRRDWNRQSGLPAQAGMTYIEITVALGIFSLLAGVAIFNYKGFQDQVDVRNLGSDIGLKIVKAQSDSRAGVRALLFPTNRKPSYGLYFEAGAGKDDFIFFADYNNDGIFDNSDAMNCDGECLEKVSMTKGNRISDLLIVDDTSEDSVPDITIVFSRISAEPVVSSEEKIFPNVEVKITAESPKGLKAFITISPSGKIEVK